ncbi:MAG: iron-sulfur cluster assembly scaffold protein [Terracidiphilus sp.]
MAYNDKGVHHYNHLRNVGTLDKSSTEVGAGLVGAPECSNVMRLQIRANPDTQVTEDVKFKTFGCGSVIASSSLAEDAIRAAIGDGKKNNGVAEDTSAATAE